MPKLRHKLLLYFVQDAHEFLNFLLNELVDILEKEAKAAKSNSGSQGHPEKLTNGVINGMANGNHKEPIVTWVHKIFQVCIEWVCPALIGCVLFPPTSIA